MYPVPIWAAKHVAHIYTNQRSFLERALESFLVQPSLQYCNFCPWFPNNWHKCAWKWEKLTLLLLLHFKIFGGDESSLQISFIILFEENLKEFFFLHFENIIKPAVNRVALQYHVKMHFIKCIFVSLFC